MKDAGLHFTSDGLPTQLGLDPGHIGLGEIEAFESIYQPDKLLLLAFWLDAKAASTWSPGPPAGTKTTRHRRVRIVRDYGMFDRREAPQYYREVVPDRR